MASIELEEEDRRKFYLDDPKENSGTFVALVFLDLFLIIKHLVSYL